jgi:hypothetical protein
MTAAIARVVTTGTPYACLGGAAAGNGIGSAGPQPVRVDTRQVGDWFSGRRIGAATSPDSETAQRDVR